MTVPSMWGKGISWSAPPCTLKHGQIKSNFIGNNNEKDNDFKYTLYHCTRSHEL
jgi:hypothetical protein